MHKMLKMHQILKTQVLEIVALEMQEIALMLKVQKTHQTALVTPLEIVTNC